MSPKASAEAHLSDSIHVQYVSLGSTVLTYLIISAASEESALVAIRRCQCSLSVYFTLFLHNQFFRFKISLYTQFERAYTQITSPCEAFTLFASLIIYYFYYILFVNTYHITNNKKQLKSNIMSNLHTLQCTVIFPALFGRRMRNVSVASLLRRNHFSSAVCVLCHRKW